MIYGYPALTGVITDPTKALDKILNSYFKSDNQKHRIDLPTYSLRMDINDGEDIASNIQSSLNSILGMYFEVYSVSVEETGTEDEKRILSMTIYVSDSDTEISLDKVLTTENGDLSSIVDAGQL